MHVMPTCHFDDAGRKRLALLNDPKLLDRRPSPPPLRTRQNRNLAHVCSLACKSISKLSQARLSPGRRPSPEGYGSDAGGNRAAAIYTLIETCKMNDVDPQAWLADVLARLPDHPASRVAELPPWTWKAAQQSKTAAAA
jgi:hypothetical protein